MRIRLWNKIKDNLLRSPDQMVSEGGAELSFEELAVFSEKFAERLQGEKCCAILCTSEMAASMALLSCFAAGVTAVPLSMRYGEAHCQKILELISPSCMITDSYGDLMVTHFGRYHYKEPEEHPALIMCTSGTTGTPKGVMLSERNVLANVQSITGYFDIGKEDRVLIARPLYHCAVLTGEFLTSIEKGSRIDFYSGSFNPSEMLKLIRGRNITTFCGTPTLLSMMARFANRVQTPTLKNIAISGECVSETACKCIHDAFPNATVYHGYGLTEACPRVCFLPPEFFKTHGTYAGIPVDGVSIKISKADGTPTEENEVGYLWAKGDNVMLGYYHNPEKTATTIKNGWLFTGDMARIGDMGFLKIMGRSDDLIIKAGMNIYPQEIESALRTDKRVTEALAYGYDHPFLGTQIGIKIAGNFSTAKEVQELCSKLLPSYQLPAKIELVRAIEKNGSGKIIRRKE